MTFDSGKINPYAARLSTSDLFKQLNDKIQHFTKANPDHQLIRLTIGDVSLPLAKGVIDAMHQAVDDLGELETFSGYGPSTGYDFLKEAIVENVYQPLGVKLELDEVFISQGAKTDVSSIQELFAPEITVGLCDPTYPVYLDSQIMTRDLGSFDPVTGHWQKVIYYPLTPDNGFVPTVPSPDSPIPDIVYLCSPANPTGVSMTRDQLQAWVDWANEHDVVLIYDIAYQAYITTPDAARSIYECKGAKECAIEIASFSKTAGFTGVRLGYTIIPKALVRQEHSLNAMWTRMLPIKMNGVSYVSQKAGAAIYQAGVHQEVKAQVDYYQTNAHQMARAFQDAGILFYGGIDSPYLWLKTPVGMSSWECFDRLLEECHLALTPGTGYGPLGEGYMRISAFAKTVEMEEATKRLVAFYQRH